MLMQKNQLFFFSLLRGCHSKRSMPTSSTAAYSSLPLPLPLPPRAAAFAQAGDRSTGASCSQSRSATFFGAPRLGRPVVHCRPVTGNPQWEGGQHLASTLGSAAPINTISSLLGPECRQPLAQGWRMAHGEMYSLPAEAVRLPACARVPAACAAPGQKVFCFRLFFVAASQRGLYAGLTARALSHQMYNKALGLVNGREGEGGTTAWTSSSADCQDMRRVAEHLHAIGHTHLAMKARARSLQCTPAGSKISFFRWQGGTQHCFPVGIVRSLIWRSGRTRRSSSRVQLPFAVFRSPATRTFCWVRARARSATRSSRETQTTGGYAAHFSGCKREHAGVAAVAAHLYA